LVDNSLFIEVSGTQSLMLLFSAFIPLCVSRPKNNLCQELFGKRKKERMKRMKPDDAVLKVEKAIPQRSPRSILLSHVIVYQADGFELEY